MAKPLNDNLKSVRCEPVGKIELRPMLVPLGEAA